MEIKKYKVGDTIAICDDLAEGILGNVNIVPPMLQYSRRKARIIAIVDDVYFLDITGSDYVWPIEAFIPVKVESKINGKFLVKML